MKDSKVGVITAILISLVSLSISVFSLTTRPIIEQKQETKPNVPDPTASLQKPTPPQTGVNPTDSTQVQSPKTSAINENGSKVVPARFECKNYEQLRFKCENANQQIDYAICDDSELKKAECAFEESYNAAIARQPDEDVKKEISANYKKFWNKLSDCGLSNTNEKPPSNFYEHQGKNCILQALNDDVKFFNDFQKTENVTLNHNTTNDTTSDDQPPVPMIDIRGIKVGMTQKEISEKLHSLKIPSWNNFTIAHVGGKDDPVKLEFHDGKLDKFTFFFDSKGFNDVLDVVSSKYTELECVDSSETNMMGLPFDQKKCKIEGTNANLELTKLFGNLYTSVLIMTSKRSIVEHQKKIQEDRI